MNPKKQKQLVAAMECLVIDLIDNFCGEENQTLVIDHNEWGHIRDSFPPECIVKFDTDEMIIAIFGYKVHFKSPKEKPLDRTGIESMGWRYEPQHSNDTLEFYQGIHLIGKVSQMSGISLHLTNDLKSGLQRIASTWNEERHQVFFEGKINNKTELITIMKMVQILKPEKENG